MYYEVLAKRVRYFKENEKGVGHMCKAIEEMIFEEKTEIVKSLLKLKKLSIEEIADASGLTEAEIIKIEEEIKETA